MVTELVDLVRRIELLEQKISVFLEHRQPEHELNAQWQARQVIASEIIQAINAYRASMRLIPKKYGVIDSESLFSSNSLSATIEDRRILEIEFQIAELKKELSRIRWLHRLMRPLILFFQFFKSLFQPKLGRLFHHAPVEIQRWGFPPASGVLDNIAGLPTISIVTPSFRQGDYVARTLESVISQNYPRLEYFVQDGGSDDKTVDVLKTYSSRLSGWVSEKDSGQSHAINLGFAKATGDIMAWLNSDDLLLPGSLDYVAKFFLNNPDVDVIYGHRILIDEQDKEIGRWILPDHDDRVLCWADFIPQETLFWRRSIWEKTGASIDESFRFAMDWDLLIRFRDAGARMVRVPFFLGAFRIHEAQKTSAAINSVGMAEMDRLRERCCGYKPNYAEIRSAIAPYIAKHLWADFSMRSKNAVGLLKS